MGARGATGMTAAALSVYLLLICAPPAQSYAAVGWGQHAFPPDLEENVTAIFSNGNAFAALKAGGEVVVWGVPDYGGDSSAVASELSANVTAIFHTAFAFAALKAGGEVVAWGSSGSGGDSSAVAPQLRANVTTIFSNDEAFAALKPGGEVVTWGQDAAGGDSSAVASELRANVTTIFNNQQSFVALKAGGEAVAWGNAMYGADSAAVASELRANVTNIFPSLFAYAALKPGGEVVTWGDSWSGGDSSVVASRLRANVTTIFSKPYAFAALKTGGEVVAWGMPWWGGDDSAVASELRANVTTIFSNSFAFAALKEEGEVVTWGDAVFGGDSSAVASELRANVTTIVGSNGAFAALKANGEVVTWGSALGDGGDSSAVASELRADVSSIYAAEFAFAALKVGGEVVTWGKPDRGGNSSAVASELRANVTAIFDNKASFVAMKVGGAVVAWGDSAYGGDMTAVAPKLQARAEALVSSTWGFAVLLCIPEAGGADDASAGCRQCEANEVWQVPAVRCVQCSGGPGVGAEGPEAVLVPDAMQRECVGCSAGLAPDSGRTSCMPCMDWEYSKAGWSQCEECPGGHIPSGGKESCSKCPPGTRTGSSPYCDQCPLLHWSDEGSTSCSFDTPWFVALLFAGLVQLAATYPFFLRLRRKVWIADVTQLGDMVVVKTSRAHGLRGRPSKLQFTGTGDPRLDKPGSCFSARVVDSHRFELLTPDGASILESIESSMGAMRQNFPRDIIDTGLPCMPIVVFSLALLPLPGLVLLAIILFAEDRHLLGPFAACYVLSTAVGVALAAGRRWRAARARTLLATRVNQFKAELLVDHPNPVSCESGPSRAVTMQQVLNLLYFFRDLVQHRSAYYLNANIILPLTKARQLSYAELAGPSQLVYFVSHYWGTSFRHFVDSIQGHAEFNGGDNWGKLSYWICFLSNNQWNIRDELGGGSPRESSFFKALRSGFCEATCMVLDADALALTRLWCIFEVLQTYRIQDDKSAFNKFKGLVFCTDRGVIGDTSKRGFDIGLTLAGKMVNLKLEDAHATNEDDERMIREMVEAEGGMEAMNAFVRSNMLATLRRLHVNFDKDAEAIEHSLTPALGGAAKKAPHPRKPKIEKL